MIAIAALSLGLFYFPLLTLIAVCWCAVLVPGRHSLWMLLLALGLIFSILNVTKEVSNDLEVYETLQRYFAGQLPTVLLHATELRPISDTYRVTEPMFYGPMWVAANFLGDDATAMPVLATLGIYIAVGSGMWMLTRRAGGHYGVAAAAVLLAAFAGLNFEQTTNVMREYLAGSMLFLALVFALGGRRVACLTSVVVACLLHNAAVVVAAGVAGLAWIFPAGPRRATGAFSYLWRGFAALLVVAIAVAASLRGAMGPSAYQSGIHLWHYGFASAVLAMYLFITAGNPQIAAERHYLGVAFAFLITVSFAFFLAHLQIPALRYFMFLEWLYAPIIFGAFLSLQENHRILASWGMCLIPVIVGTAVLVMRLSHSVFSYGPGGIGILTTSFPGVLGYVIR